MRTIIKQKIAEADTIPKLDDLRLEIIEVSSESVETAKELQEAFIKQKNKLRRIPLKDRIGW